MKVWEPILYWNVVPDSRRLAIINSLVRLCFAPIFIAAELALVSKRLVEDEPEAENLASVKGAPVCNGYSSHGNGPLKTIPVVRPKSTKLRTPWLFRNRFRLCWEDSGAVLLQGILYVIILDLLAALGLQHVFRLFRDDLERLLAMLTGRWYVTAAGDRFPLSPCSADTTHRISGHCLGQDDAGAACRGPIDTPRRASFMAACCNLSYELEPVICDVVTNRWGLELTSYANVPANLHLGHDYAPDLIWFAATGDKGTVIAFTGAQPWLKVDRHTDILTALQEVPGCGRMLKGFVGAFDNVETGSKATPYSSLKTLIAGFPQGHEVFLTGHSLGGGLAVVLAMLLSERDRDLGERLAGVFTLGAPRIGDQQFARCAKQKFQGRLFRYVMGSDLVVKLPHAVHGIRFEHHHGLRFITSESRLLKEEDGRQLVLEREQHENRWAYIHSAYKVLRLVREVHNLADISSNCELK